MSLTSTILIDLFIAFGWILLLMLGNMFNSRGKERKAEYINFFGGIWIILALFYFIYLYISYILNNPFILPITFGVIITIITLNTMRLIFPSQYNIFFKDLSRYKNIGFFAVLISPILIGICLYLLKANIIVETARILYSSIFLAFISLLALVVMFSIFIIERPNVPHRIINLLIGTVKGVSIMYGFTIIMSLLAIVTLSNNDISFNYSLMTLNSSFMSSILFGTLSISISSIVLTIIIFFQIVNVLKEEIPPSANQVNVLFDETRLFRSGLKTECSIENEGDEGYSEFRYALEDTDFYVSSIKIKPIKYETLNNYDVLVIPRVNEDYSTNEIEAIERFVKEKGGGLLLTSGFYDHESKNIITKQFGLEFGLGLLNQKKNNFENIKVFPEVSKISKDKIFNNIKKFHLINARYISKTGSSEILANSDEDAWLEKPNEKPDTSGNFPVISKMKYGKGRIVFISSYYQFTNEWIGKLNNKQLGLSFIKWLADKKESEQVTFET